MLQIRAMTDSTRPLISTPRLNNFEGKKDPSNNGSFAAWIVITPTPN